MELISAEAILSIVGRNDASRKGERFEERGRVSTAATFISQLAFQFYTFLTASIGEAHDSPGRLLARIRLS